MESSQSGLGEPEFTEKGKLRFGSYFCPECGHITKWGPLSKSEIEILRLYWEGKSTREIAVAKCVSVKTIEAQRKTIYLKTNTSTLALAFRWGLDNGYLKL